MCFKLIKKRNNINSLSLHQFPDASINSVSVGKRSYKKKMNMTKRSGAPNDNFGKLSVRKNNLRSRIFGSFSKKFLPCLS